MERLYLVAMSVFGKKSSSHVTIDYNLHRYLALVCLFRQEDFEKYGLIDYNFQCFKKAIQEVYQVKTRMALAGNPTVTSQSETMDSTPFTL